MNGSFVLGPPSVEVPGQRTRSSQDSVSSLTHCLQSVRTSCAFSLLTLLCAQPLVCTSHLRLSPAYLRTTPTSSVCLRLPHFCLQPLRQFLRCPSNGVHQTPGKLKALCCDIHFPHTWVPLPSLAGSLAIFPLLMSWLQPYSITCSLLMSYILSQLCAFLTLFLLS